MQPHDHTFSLAQHGEEHAVVATPFGMCMQATEKRFSSMDKEVDVAYVVPPCVLHPSGIWHWFVYT